MIHSQQQIISEEDINQSMRDPIRSDREAMEKVLAEMKVAIVTAMEAAAQKQRDIQAVQNT